MLTQVPEGTGIVKKTIKSGMFHFMKVNKLLFLIENLYF